MPTTSAKKAFIDSNVLVYAYHPGSPNHGTAVELLDVLYRQRDATLSIQNLVEFSNTITSKSRSPIDFEKLTLFAANLRDAFGVMPYTAKTVLAAFEISNRHAVHFFDALLAATMIENGITTIYTENTKDFEKIPGIRAVNPFE